MPFHFLKHYLPGSIRSVRIREHEKADILRLGTHMYIFKFIYL